jgi:hypothetical protein
MEDINSYWISVKDSLPDKYQRVLVTNGEDICLHYKQSGWNYEGDEGSDLFPISEGIKDSDGNWASCCSLEEGEITHWMYMPIFKKE